MLHSQLRASWWVNILELIFWQAVEKNRLGFRTAGSLPTPSRKPHILHLNALKMISRSSPNVITLLERWHPCNWSPMGHNSHYPLKYASYSVLNFYVDLIIRNFYLLLSENINPVNQLKHFPLFRIYSDLLRKEGGAPREEYLFHLFLSLSLKSRLASDLLVVRIGLKFLILRLLLLKFWDSRHAPLCLVWGRARNQGLPVCWQFYPYQFGFLCLKHGTAPIIYCHGSLIACPFYVSHIIKPSSTASFSNCRFYFI